MFAALRLQVGEQFHELLIARLVTLFETLMNFRERLLPKLGMRLQAIIAFLLQLMEGSGPNLQLSLERTVERIERSAAAGLNGLQKWRQALIDDLEPAQQFAIDAAVDGVNQAAFGAFAKKQAEHHRDRGGQGDGRGAKGRADLAHDLLQIIGYLVRVHAYERGCEMDYGAEDAQHRRNPADEADQAVVSVGLLVILLGQIAEMVFKAFGRLFLLNVVDGGGQTPAEARIEKPFGPAL